jgi:hypothetical protein
MSKSHKHIAEDEKEKATNQIRKPESNTDAATKPADPAEAQEAGEGSFSPISVPGDTSTSSHAAKADDNLMSQPQHQQKPHPKPHPQQKK